MEASSLATRDFISGLVIGVMLGGAFTFVLSVIAHN
jgi:hypothetical protein